MDVRWRSWFAIGLSLTLGVAVACSKDAEKTAVAREKAAVSPSGVAPTIPVDPGPDGLGGRWKLLMGTMTWTVQLAPREGSPGEYWGEGRRETFDERGQPVTMWVSAVVDGRTLRAWLGLGVIKCSGRFHKGGMTEGNCQEMGGQKAGSFRAERLDPWPPGLMK